jgi:hypothetical protein
MHPALSVIVFTTASGAGYGLLALFGVLAAIGALPADRAFGATGLSLALALISAGLLASTVHLGRPERAWRAFSQWRSSWLSREGVAAVATYVPALAFAAGWLMSGETGGWVAAARFAQMPIEVQPTLPAHRVVDIGQMMPQRINDRVLHLDGVVLPSDLIPAEFRFAVVLQVQVEIAAADHRLLLHPGPITEPAFHGHAAMQIERGTGGDAHELTLPIEPQSMTGNPLGPGGFGEVIGP